MTALEVKSLSGSSPNLTQPRKESVNLKTDQLEITLIKTQREKGENQQIKYTQTSRKTEQSIQKLCDNIKQSSICVIGVLE